MRWDEKRARASERKWIYLTGGLLLVPLILYGAVSAVPYVRSRTSWSEQVSSARDVHDYTEITEGATYDEIVDELGIPSGSGPAFESADAVLAGVYYWNSGEGEIRGLLVRGRLVGSMKVGVWR